MKTRTSLPALTLAILLLLSAILPPMTALAAPEGLGEGESCEIVILMDVSGSMNKSDPVNAAKTRLSIEAIESFPDFCSSNYLSNIILDVIAYEENVFPLVEGAVVGTSEGQIRIDNAVSTLKSGKVDGYKIYNLYTDIGGALKAGSEMLAKSEANKKAVILFTDGKIDFSKNKAERTAASMANSDTARDALNAAGIPIYTVGLNADGTVNEAYLRDLSEKTGGETFICTEAKQISKCFSSVATYLNGQIPSDADPVEVSVSPEVETSVKLDIIGQIISETNIRICADVPVSSLKITAPSGITFASIDYKNNKRSVEPTVCDVRETSSRSTLTAKLFKPVEDGEWTVSFTAEAAGTATLQIVSYYDISVGNAASDPKTVMVGKSAHFAPYLINEDQAAVITNAKVYQNSVCKVIITSDNDRKTLEAGISPAGNSFAFDYTFPAPGAYTINYVVENSQLYIRGETSLTVTEPGIALSCSAQSFELKAGTGLTVTVIDPETGAALGATPDYMAGRTLTVTAALNGKKTEIVRCSASELKNGNYTAAFKPTETGVYSVSASLDGPGSSVTAAPIEVCAAASAISEIKDNGTALPEKIAGVILGNSYVYDLAKFYSDSDGDAVTFTLADQKDPAVEAKLSGSTLTVVPRDIASGKVTFTASDGHGAVFTRSITVESAAPALTIETSGSAVRAKGVTVTATVTDGSAPLTAIPEGLKDAKLLLTATGKDGKAVEAGSVALSALTDGKAEFAKFVPGFAGDTTFTVTLDPLGLTASETVNMKVSAITDNETLPDEIRGVAAGTLTRSYDLDGAFEDSDGDKPVLSVSVEGKGIEAEIDESENKLIVRASGSAKGTVTVSATDGHGANAAERTISVKTTSLVIILLIAAIVLAVLAAAAVAAFLYIRHSRIINVPFSVRIVHTSRDDESYGEETEAIYTISGYLTQRTDSKPVMPLQQILGDGSIAALTGGDENLLSLCSADIARVTLSGLPFGKEGVVLYVDGKKQDTFTSRTVTAKLGKNFSVSVGALKAFARDDYSDYNY